MSVNRCKICGVKMIQPWISGICIMCDWHLGEGYSEEEIKKMLDEPKKQKFAIQVGDETIEALDDDKILINGQELSSIYEMKKVLNMLVKMCVILSKGR